MVDTLKEFKEVTPNKDGNCELGNVSECGSKQDMESVSNIEINQLSKIVVDLVKEKQTINTGLAKDEEKDKVVKTGVLMNVKPITEDRNNKKNEIIIAENIESRSDVKHNKGEDKNLISNPEHQNKNESENNINCLEQVNDTTTDDSIIVEQEKVPFVNDINIECDDRSLDQATDVTCGDSKTMNDNYVQNERILITSTAVEQVFHEVTVTTDSISEEIVQSEAADERTDCLIPNDSDNVLHEFITINNKTSSEGISGVNKEFNHLLIESLKPIDDNVIIIEKVIEGLIDDDDDDSDDVSNDSDEDELDNGNVSYVSGTNDLVIVQKHVDDVIEEYIEDETYEENVIYCSYDQSENPMEKGAFGDVEYILKIDGDNTALLPNGVMTKMDYQEEVIKNVNDSDITLQSVVIENGILKKPSMVMDKCNICLKEINKDSMRRHLKRHNGIKFCPYCSKSYYDILKYNEHLGTHKSNEGNEKYMCYVCRKKFCFLKNIYKHLRNAHPDDTKYNDIIILLPDNGNNNKNNIFVNKERKIKKHMKNCHVCNQLVTNIYYKRHLQSHSGERPFACRICDKRFYEKSTLKNHIRTHTGERPYKCEYCEKSFGHISTLAKHLNIHTGAKKFQCEICSKYVSSSYNLKLHHRIHTGEKPFRCVRCDKNFASKAGLEKHVASFHAT